eukprot:10157317-Ditylum_brightwellii.AAC.1
MAKSKKTDKSRHAFNKENWKKSDARLIEDARGPRNQKPSVKAAALSSSDTTKKKQSASSNHSTGTAAATEPKTKKKKNLSEADDKS